MENKAKQNLYIRFYYKSFLDLVLASTLTNKDSKNSIELLEYKSLFLQQSLEKLFKAILLVKDKNYNPQKRRHNLTDLAQDIFHFYNHHGLVQIIDNIYQKNLNTKYPTSLKTRMLEEIISEKEIDYPSTNEEEFIFFRHFCISLEKGFLAVRYPEERIHRKLLISELLRGTDILLNTTIEVHKRLLQVFFRHEELKRIITKIYRGSYRKHLSLEYKILNYLKTFFFKTQDDIIQNLITRIFE